MKPLTNAQNFRFAVTFLYVLLIFGIISCDKTEDLFLSDSEKLMKDLKGKYNLVSVRHEDYYSVNGGFSWILEVDTTYNASGSIDLSSVDKAEYNGTLTIIYMGFNETHAVNGSAVSSSDNDKLWIITDGQENIQPLVLFNPPANYLESLIEERSGNLLTLKFAEESWNSAGLKYRYYKFEKAK